LGVVPINAPFMYVVTQIMKAVSVWRIQPDRFRSALPTLGVIGNQLGRRISPRVQRTFCATPSGAFPLGFARQAIGLVRRAIQPLAIRYSLMPRQRDDRHLRMIEIRIVPAQRLRVTHRGKEAGVLLIRHLINSKLKSIHPNAMHWLFIIAPDFAAHPEPALWDTHHHRFDGPDPDAWEDCHGLSIHTITRNWLRTFAKTQCAPG